MWKYLLSFFLFVASQVLPVSFSGLVLAESFNEVLKPSKEKIELIGIDLPGTKKELEEALSLVWGKSLNKESILEIKEALLEFYQKRGRRFVQVQIPPQKVEEGVLICCIIENVLDEIVSSDRSLLSHLNLEKDSFINVLELSEDLKWINQNPFRKVSAVFTPSAKVGKTNVEFQVEERRPYKIVSGISNNTLTAGASWGGFTSGQILSYQGNYGFDSEKSQGHLLHYEIPLPGKSLCTFSASYSRKKKLVDLETLGLAFQYKMLLQPSHELMIGMNFKSIFLDFLQVEQAHLAQGIVGYLFHFDKKLDLSLELLFSPASFHVHSTLIQPSILNFLAKLSVNSFLSLPYGFALKNSFFLQAVTSPLLFSEQMGIGGVSSVRGYEHRMFGGDEGVILNSEILAPSRKIISAFSSKWKDAAQFLLFFDYGYVRGLDAGRSLASMGGGMRYLLDPYLSLKVDVGVPIFERRGVGTHFSAFFTY